MERLKSTSVWAFFCLLVPLLVFTSCFDPVENDTHPVSGRVYLCAGGMENVKITLSHDTKGDYVFTTGENGNFTISSVWKGTYTLTPQAEGFTFTPPSRTFTVVDEEVINQDFLMVSSWSKTFDSYGDSKVFAIEQTLDCGYVMTGYRDTSGELEAANFDLWVLKLDHLGTVEWSKTFGGDQVDIGYDIKQIPAGGYIVVGDTYSGEPDVTGHQGLADYWILRLNENGEIDEDDTATWEKAYGGEYYEHARSVWLTNDNQFLVSGYSDSFGFGLFDFWFMKIDRYGATEVSWTDTFGTVDWDYSYRAIQTSYGDVFNEFLIAGDRLYNDSGTDYSIGTIVKLDAEFQNTWDKTYRAGSSDTEAGNIWNSIRDMKETMDGGFITAGYTEPHGSEPTQSDLWIMKLNADGEKAWELILDHGNLDRSFSIEQTTDAGFIAGGTSWRDDTASRDFWIIKLDQNGTVQWEKTFDGGYGSIDEVTSIHQTGDGGYIIAGNSQSFEGNDRVRVIKLNNFGELTGTYDE